MYHTLCTGQRRTLYFWKKKILTCLFASLWIYGTALLFINGCSSADSTGSLEGPSPELRPEEELETFQIDPGLKLQLVAAEPMVQDPVVFTFDEDGRIWVVEMRAYMPNIEGEGEREPNGRVSVLEDTDGDGIMDTSTVYIDSLILPRAVAIVGEGVLVVSEEALWMTKDLDGDLRADTKTLIDADYAGNTQPEHAGNGLWRGIDNWYYNAKSRFRYKFLDGAWIKDSTEFRGQWGISHDDQGRLYYNYNWSQLHADLVPPNYLNGNPNHTPTSGIDQGLNRDRRVYPIRPTPAVNRGYIPGILTEDKKLKEFTAACSPFVYRGTALPEEYYGNAFVCEPSGNLIKRNVVESSALHLSAYDPHPGKEFLASTDERFRPVHHATGPDGALYIADMYRGLIQHKAYVTPYLEEQTLSRKLVHPIHRGRIWRIVPEGWKRPKTVKLSKLPPDLLAGYLSHPDGWYRDMAQRLLVERKDKSILPLLVNLALTCEHHLGRFHALWTMEGLGSLDTDLLFRLLSDPHPLVSSTALRLLEPPARADQRFRQKLGTVLLKAWPDAPLEQILQMALSSRVLNAKDAHTLLMGIAISHDTSALIRDAILSSIGNQELVFMRRLQASAQWKDRTPSHEIFLEMLVSSIARKRDPAELKTLLSMLAVEQNSFGWQERAILTGLSIQGYSGKTKPVHLTSPPRILQRKDLNIPDSQLDGLAALFEWPGSVSKESQVLAAHALNEEEKQQFVLGRKFYLSSCSGCHGNNGEGLNRFAPPLRRSEWVIGDEKRLALILLHGIEGPLNVAGKHYDEPDILPVMPGHFTLSDKALGAVLTYIRNEWGNQAGAVDPKTVGKIRLTHQGRTMPWTGEELNAHIEELNNTE